jgi:hypothetical protein
MTSLTIERHETQALRLPRGLISTVGALAVVAGFLGPYLRAGTTALETPRWVFGYELPFERISALGTAAGRTAPLEWLLAFGLASIAGTIVIFALHYELLDRPGLARFLRIVSTLGLVASCALFYSVALHFALPTAGPGGVNGFASLAHGLMHVGPGLYLSLLGFVVARLDPTL